MSWYGGNENDDEMTNGYLPSLDGPQPESPGVAPLGNSNAANFPKDESALNLVNSPSVKQEFGLSGPPIPPPRRGLSKGLGRAIPKFNKSVGDIQWQTGETWGVLIGGIAIGMIALTAWNRATK
jgi:hypothetical protein